MGQGNLKPLVAKKNPISDDYRLTGSVLGLGINGKVHECYHRQSQEKFALKVCLHVVVNVLVFAVNVMLLMFHLA